MIKQWQELKETITEMRDNDGTGTQQDVCKFLADYMEVLEKQMQQPCEDCISRAKALDTLKKSFLGMSFERYKKAKRMFEQLPSVTPQTITEFADKCKECGKIQNELYEDCISRKAVEKITWEEPSYTDALNVLTEVREKIRQLPSVKPKYTDEEIDRAQAVEQAYVDKMVELAVEEMKRPEGKWIKVITNRDEWGETWHFKCSLCGEKSNKGYRPLENYCHNCGAEMSGGGEK